MLRARVLNARRHHDEEEAIAQGPSEPSPLRCLTPEGITTRKSFLDKRFVFPRRVLNARRHHDEEEYGPIEGETRLRRCLTPEGITTRKRLIIIRYGSP